MKRVIVVSDEQVDAAQALVRISGGPDNVRPLIAKIATAPPATLEQKREWLRSRGATPRP